MLEHFIWYWIGCICGVITYKIIFKKEGKELEMTEDEEEYIDYVEDKGDE